MNGKVKLLSSIDEFFDGDSGYGGGEGGGWGYGCGDGHFHLLNKTKARGLCRQIRLLIAKTFVQKQNTSTD